MQGNMVHERMRWAEWHTAWMRVLVMASSVALFPWIVRGSVSFQVSVAILGSGSAYAIAAFVLSRLRYGKLHRWTFVLAAMDIGLAWVSVLTTQGARSPVLPVLYLVTFSLAFRHPPRAVAVETATVCLSYILLVLVLGQAETGARPGSGREG